MNKKVLFIHHGGIAGGAPLSMLYTMQGVREHGYSPIVGLVHTLPELHSLYNSHGFETFEMPYIPVFITWSGSEGKRYNPIMWKGLYDSYKKWKNAKVKLLKFIQDQKIDLLHLNSVSLSNPAELCMEHNIPFVWHVREHGPKHRGNRYSFLQKRLLKAQNVIFLSQAEEESWLDGMGKGTIVHNFINFEKFDYKKDFLKTRNDLGLIGKKVLLYVGGAKKHKGIIVLLKALTIVKEKYTKDFVCLMPDTYIDYTDKKLNSLQKEILYLIEKFELKEICKLMPFNPDIVNLFGASDILLFPAIKPHFARPIIEGSAMKKPVIASDLKAIDELVIPNKTGYLIPANDSQSLADSILELLINTDLCKEMGEEGYHFAVQNFEYHKQIGKVLKVYENVYSF